MTRLWRKGWTAGLMLGVLVPVTAIGAPAEAPPLSDMMPQGTLLYAAWPGIDVLAEASGETELAKMMAEPQVVRFRTAWREKLMPAVEELLAEQAPPGTWESIAPAVKSVIGAAWKYPTALGLIGMGMSEQGPQIDVALVVEAGSDAKKLAKSAEGLLGLTGLPVADAAQVDAGGAKLKELLPAGPTMPLRWGVVKDTFVLTIGTKMTEHLSSGDAAKSLSADDRFAAAMKVVEASAASPTAFLDIQGVVKTLEAFQPMFAASEVPVLGEEGGVAGLLEAWGLGSLESVSMAMVPHEAGFKSIVFVRAPGADFTKAGGLAGKPLTAADLAVVPRDVSWASVTNTDLAAVYGKILGMLEVLSEDVHEQIVEMISDLEAEIGLSIEKDLLASFEDGWAVFDAPRHGGLWFTGITVVAEVKPGNKLDDVLTKIVGAIAEAAGATDEVTVREEAYRDQTIHYVNVAGVPMPIAPAWAQYKGRWILALYPQMVRLTLDHLMDKGPSLADNADFKRGRAVMPKNAYTLKYVDSAAGFRDIYAIVLPVAQALIAMGQSQGIDVDVTMLPAMSVLERHVFGNVAAQATIEDGLVGVMYGSFPVAVPSLGGGAMIPMMAAIMLPSLARAREMSKRTVSAANLKGIGTGMYTYAADHNDKYPPDLQALVEAGIMSPRALISPLEKDPDAESSYIYIKDQTTNGHQMNVIAFEKPANYDGEGTNVLFTDAHVEFVRMHRLRELLEQTFQRLDREMPEEIREMIGE